jgi:hypothetical protein
MPVAEEALVRSRVSPREICGGRSGTGTGVSPTTLVLPCQYHSTNVPYSFLSTCSSYLKDKRVKPGNLPYSSTLSEVGKHWMENNFHRGSKGRAMALTDSRRSDTVEARVRSRASPCDICGGHELYQGRFFSEYFRFSPVIINPPMLHTHLHQRATLVKTTNGRSLGEFQMQLCLGNRGALDRIVLPEGAIPFLHEFICVLKLLVMMWDLPRGRDFFLI